MFDTYSTYRYNIPIHAQESQINTHMFQANDFGEKPSTTPALNLDSIMLWHSDKVVMVSSSLAFILSKSNV